MRKRWIGLLFATHIFSGVAGYTIGVVREEDANWKALKLETEMVLR